MLKEVEMTDFHFNVHMDGKIPFEIHYEEDVLPEVFPEARTRVSRAAKAAMPQPAENEEAEAIEAAAEDEPEDSQPTDEPQAENPGEPTAEETETESIEAAYHVTGIRRKELAAAVGDFIGANPEYPRAPTYAFAVGS